MFLPTANQLYLLGTSEAKGLIKRPTVMSAETTIRLQGLAFGACILVVPGMMAVS